MIWGLKLRRGLLLQAPKPGLQEPRETHDFTLGDIEASGFIAVPTARLARSKPRHAKKKDIFKSQLTLNLNQQKPLLSLSLCVSLSLSINPKTKALGGGR